jgi:hypothetical protein
MFLTPVFAGYLDPAFGGMLLQVIIAIVAVSGAVLFSLRKKIRGLFKKEKGKANPYVRNNTDNDEMVDTLDDN